VRSQITPRLSSFRAPGVGVGGGVGIDTDVGGACTDAAATAGLSLADRSHARSIALTHKHNRDRFSIPPD
jgi:hypothetical protein